MKKVLVLLIVAMLSLVVVSAIHAQEVTDSPATPTLEATQPPGDGGSTVGGGIFNPDVVAAIFAVITFLGVGFAAGRYRPGEVARNLEKDKAALDSAEKIALNTIPLSALETIRSIVADATDVLRVAGKILDGQPNDAPPDEPPTSG